MWINLSNEELSVLQASLDVVTSTTNAKLWAKMQRRKEGEAKLQKEKEKLEDVQD